VVASQLGLSRSTSLAAHDAAALLSLAGGVGLGRSDLVESITCNHCSILLERAMTIILSTGRNGTLELLGAECVFLGLSRG
jgi:hypothetical protein